MSTEVTQTDNVVLAVPVNPYKEEIERGERQASALVVEDAAGKDHAIAFIRQIKKNRSLLKDLYGDIQKQAYKAHKDICAKVKTFSEPLDRAEAVIKGKVRAYDDAQEALRREEARKEGLRLQKAHDAALRRAEVATAKLLEGAGSLEGKIKALNNALCNPNVTELEENAMESQRAALQGQLDQLNAKVEAKREAIEEMPETYEPIPVEPPKKTDGANYRTSVAVTVTNPKLLLQAVVKGIVPDSIITFDLKAILNLVKGGMALPGVVKGEDKTLIVRKR